MQIDIGVKDGAAMITPHGDVDMSCARELQAALHQALREKPARLIVDLTHVPYMDSSGVATLVEAMQIARKNGTRMALASLQDKVRSIFEIARLDTVFTIHPSADAAIGA